MRDKTLFSEGLSLFSVPPGLYRCSCVISRRRLNRATLLVPAVGDGGGRRLVYILQDSVCGSKPAVAAAVCRQLGLRFSWAVELPYLSPGVRYRPDGKEWIRECASHFMVTELKLYSPVCPEER